MNETLQHYLEERAGESEEISAERKQVLGKLGQFVGERERQHKECPLLFICTHNSRRSHMGQAAAFAAADYYGLRMVQCYSGGTEATALYAEARRAIEATGLLIEADDPGVVAAANPIYRLRTEPGGSFIRLFSKQYTDPENPHHNFAAVMVCSSADEACPVVLGAEQRFSLTFSDPKHFDGRPEAPEKYQERMRDISREIVYAFALAAKRD